MVLLEEYPYPALYLKLRKMVEYSASNDDKNCCFILYVIFLAFILKLFVARDWNLRAVDTL